MIIPHGRCIPQHDGSTRNPGMLLGLNLALPLLVLAVALAQDRLDHRRPDWPARQRAAWRRTLLGCMLVATALTLVITWQKDFRAREGRAQIAETAQEQEEKARTERKEISDEIKELAVLVGAMDPRLTDEQALSRIGLEILRLRERTSELEDELDGLRKYRSVARLNVLGLSGRAGAGLTESSALSRALEGAYETTVMGSNTTHRTKCDEESVSRFVDVATKVSSFPVCALGHRCVLTQGRELAVAGACGASHGNSRSHDPDLGTPLAPRRGASADCGLVLRSE